MGTERRDISFESRDFCSTVDGTRMRWNHQRTWPRIPDHVIAKFERCVLGVLEKVIVHEA